jgi:signal transduction histidine kinase
MAFPFAGSVAKWWQLPLLLLGFLLSACSAAPQDHRDPLSHAPGWWMDTSGLATLQEVQQVQNWQPLPKWKSWGFGTETIWVRLQVKAGESDERTPWAVRIRPSFLDYVTLYDPASDLVIRTGDALPPDSDGLSSINFTLQIPVVSHERAVYLQIRSTSARALNVEVLPYGQAQRLNRMQEWLLGFVTVSSGIFAVWASIQWWISREKVIGAFAIKQFFAMGWTFFILGFARVAFGSSWPEGLLSSVTSLLLIGLVAVTLWFFSVLFEAYQPARWTLRAMRCLSALVCALPLLHWIGQTHWMLMLTNASILLAVALMLTALVTAIPRKVKQPIPLAVLLVYVAVYGLLNSTPPAIYIGWVEAHPAVMFTNLAHAVMDGVVIFVILQIRAASLRRSQMQIELDLRRTQQEAETEKRFREDQSQLFAMLAHEMKTPLATMRMWMEAGPLKPEMMERAIFDMNQVIERCVHTGQLADRGLQPLVQAVDPETITLTCIEVCRSPERVDFIPRPSDTPLHTDAQMLSIALGNLMDNACKYSAAGSRIQVKMGSDRRADQPGWSWQIINTPGNAGLPEADKLFAKYYRGAQARRVSGSGLGLFLVKGLLELMRGSVAYREEAGCAVFELWVPEHP